MQNHLEEFKYNKFDPRWKGYLMYQEYHPPSLNKYNHRYGTIN